MKKKIVRFSGYLFFAVGIYSIFLVTLFPVNSFLPLISARIKQSTGINVRINSASLGFPARLSMRGITLLEDSGKEIYKAKSARLSVRLISLLTFSPELSYLVKGEETTLEGRVYKGDEKKLNIDMALDSNSPDELLPYLKEAGSITLQGKIAITGSLKIPLKALGQNRFNPDSIESAKFDIDFQKMRITLPEMPVKNLSDFSFSRIKGSLSLLRGQVGIDLNDIAGDVNGSLKGKIIIMNPVFKSRLDIRSRFKPSEDLINRAGSFLSILSRKKGPGGVYTVDIKGSVQKPLPII